MGKLTREDMTLESGLADDFDGVIVDLRFEVDSQYAAKSNSQDPMLTVVIDSPTIEEPITQRYSLGAKKQWRSAKGGREVVSGLDPNAHKFNVKSRAGTLVHRMFELAGDGDLNKGQDFFIDRGYMMTQAEFFIGLNYHWKREPLPVVDAEAGTKDVLLPTKSLGLGAAPTAAQAASPELDAEVVKLATGKDERGLKIAALKSEVLKKYPDYMRDLVSGSKIQELIGNNTLALGPDGKFI